MTDVPDEGALGDVGWLVQAGVPLDAPSMQASLAATPAAPITMRDPCPNCAHPMGLVTDTSGQDVVRCAKCSTFCYNRPKSESGKPQRQVRSHPNLKPGLRGRVLALYDNRCVMCGRMPPHVNLHVDHWIPLELGHQLGFDEDVLHGELNLVPLCEECNLGAGDTMNTKSLVVFFHALRAKQAAP